MLKLKELANLLRQEGFLKEQLLAASELSAKAAENEVVVSVIGQFKRGKSSLINAILGEQLLPVGIIPLTTVVTEIRFSKEFKAMVFYENGTDEIIKLANIGEYISEENNAGNNKKVSRVKIWTPQHPFGENTVLVDTPGVGSIHKHNTDSSYSYLEQSDAILFLLAVDSPVSETERDFLLQAKKYAAKFYFVVNKRDIVSPEDLQKFMDFCQKVISESMGNAFPLWPVSANSGEGIRELTEGLEEELKKSHNNLLAQSLTQKKQIIMGQAKAKIQLTLTAENMPVEELHRKLTLLDEKRTELYDFSDQLNLLANHKSSELVRKIKKSMEDESVDLKELIKQTSEIKYGSMRKFSANRFSEEYQKEMDGILREELNKLNALGIEQLERGYTEIVDILNGKTTETAKFVAAMIEEQFNQDYPIEENSFQVSERSDFFLRIGWERPFMLNIEALAQFLPRSIANKRFYHRWREQALVDVDRNMNNMLYNYRYKMQESLRTLCGELAEKLKNIANDLASVSQHMEKRFSLAEEDRQAEEKRLKELLLKLSD